MDSAGHVERAAPARRRYPVEPKAYGALFGAGTGGGLAAAVITILEQQVTHGPLASGYVDAIYLAAGLGVTFLGAWLAPHQPRPGDADYEPEPAGQPAAAAQEVSPGGG